MLLPAVLGVMSLGPGLLLVRGLRWNPLERLCVAVGASLFLTYLFALARFLLQLSVLAHTMFSAACAICLFLAMGELSRMARSRRARRTLIAYAGLLLWVVALLALVRHYSGALFAGDWHGHYRKAVFFLFSSSSDPSAAASLLDRPPALNLIWSHVMAQVGTRFDTLQLTHAFLATLTLLPCCLLAPALLGRGQRRPRGRTDPLLIASLLALCPLFVQNATYTWTKLPAVFCTVLAVALYVKGTLRADTTRLALSFTFFAFGCLMHFTAVPFAVFALLHYLARGPWTGARWWRQTALIGICGASVLATWYGWTAGRFGLAANFASHPTLHAAGRASVEDNVARAARNAVGTLVPHVFRDVGAWFAQPSALGYLRDHTFTLYSGNLFATMGSVGGLLVGYLLWRALAPKRNLSRSRSAMRNAGCLLGGAALAIGMMYVPPVRNVLVHALPSPALLAGGLVALAAALASFCRNVRDRAAFTSGQRFWRGLIVCAFVVSIAAWDAVSDLGIAHACMQPLAYIGLTLLAAHLPVMPRPLRIIAVVGMAIDFLLGILLHFGLQHHTFIPGHDPGLVQQARLNWLEKQAAEFTFVGDHFARGGFALAMLLVAGAMAMVCYVAVASTRQLPRPA